MKTIKLSMAAAAALILGLSSCKKEETTTTATPLNGAVIELSHKFGMMNEQTLAIGTPVIHPMKYDTLTFSKFKYFISNVKFKKADGTYWTETESYHLVDLATAESLQLNFKDLPAGTYTEMEYTIGVDSARNVSGAQTGALTTTNDMYWGWKSGYIMLKAEGKYKDNNLDKTFVFHLGGFSGENNIVTKRTMKFEDANTLTIIKDKRSKISVEVNPGLLWHSAPSVKEVNKIHDTGAAAKLMALGESGMGFFSNPMYSFKLISVK
jgi:uncharacterized lipoprotein YehR (DUF1307 family)